MSDTSEPPQDDRVECPAARDPAVRLFIFAAMMLGFGAWTIYDHYYKGEYAYPEKYELGKYLGYLFNHYGPYVLVPLGLIAVFLAIRHLRRVLVADAEGIGYAGGARVGWDEITSLDASLLKDKGILRLHYGTGGTLTLDSWKLKNFKAMVAYVEKHVPAATSAPDEGEEP